MQIAKSHGAVEKKKPNSLTMILCVFMYQNLPWLCRVTADSPSFNGWDHKKMSFIENNPFNLLFWELSSLSGCRILTAKLQVPQFFCCSKLRKKKVSVIGMYLSFTLSFSSWDYSRTWTISNQLKLTHQYLHQSIKTTALLGQGVYEENGYKVKIWGKLCWKKVYFIICLC